MPKAYRWTKVRGHWLADAADARPEEREKKCTRERRCSRQIEKEIRGGQACTHKFEELEVRQLVGAVELRASCSIARQRSTGHTLTGILFPNGLETSCRDAASTPKGLLAQHLLATTTSPPHLRSPACHLRPARPLGATVPIVSAA